MKTCTVSVWLLVFSALSLSLLPLPGGSSSIMCTEMPTSTATSPTDLISVSTATPSTSAGVVVPSVQVVPQGIQSVNGSDVNMGCACSLADIDDLILCGKSSDSESYNYLVDGDSPVIADWASQLVTVRKNEKNDVINFDHVVLTFGFDPAMSPTAIELDLFLCPEWKIGAPYITVYADESKDTYGLVFNYSSVQANVIDFIRHYTPNKTSCDSLSNVSISLKEHAGAFYFTWHIVVSFAPQPDIEWVHVGEVRFFGSTADPDPIQSSSFAINDMPSAYTSIITTRATSILSQLQSSSVPGSTTSQLQSQLQSTSVPGGREIDCTCSECSRSAVITVSAVSLLLIVTLTTVVLTQCLLMVRMKKSTDVLHRNDIYEDVLTPTTMLPDNAYMLHKMTTSSEEATYEFVK